MKIRQRNEEDRRRKEDLRRQREREEDERLHMNMAQKESIRMAIE